MGTTVVFHRGTHDMLTNAPITTILPVKDLNHARAFYQDKNIAASIAELKKKGVTFSDYDLPGLKTVNHVCVLGAEKAAWFNDTEGNILCLHEDVA